MNNKRSFIKAGILIVFILALIISSLQPVTHDLDQLAAASDMKLIGEATPTATVTQESNEPISENTPPPTQTEDVEKKQEQPNTTTPPREQTQQPSDKPLNAATIVTPEQGDPNPSSTESTVITVNGEDGLDNTYFTTNLYDGLIVTVPDFHVVLTHLNEALTAIETSATLNGQPVMNFSSKLAFEEGENAVTITVLYEDKQQQPVQVTQNYNVQLNSKDLVIQTNLKDHTTQKDLLYFVASAAIGEKTVPVTVSYNDEVITSSSNSFSLKLKDGANTIQITAQDGSHMKTFEANVTYEKPKGQITFDTTLQDQKVAIPQYTFEAQAFYNSEAIPFTVSFNGEPLQDAAQYEVTLKNGTNTIQLAAKHAGEQLTKQFKILYTDPSVAPVEVIDKLAPTLKTDLQDGASIKGLVKTINVWPTTASGERIRGKNVAVKVNGTGIPFVWDDAEKTSYKLSLQDGLNKVEIRVWDNDGRVTKQTFSITAKNMDKQVIGQATISLEASVLGIPYLIAPTKVDIHQNEKGSYIIDQFLRKHGFKYDQTGTLDNNFYLSAIYKQNMLANVAIPEDLWTLVEQNSARSNRDDYDLHSLGEFDFANGAGWMYSINGDYPNYGFSDAYFLDGDVVRIRFTLHYGKDIGGYNGLGGSNDATWNKEW